MLNNYSKNPSHSFLKEIKCSFIDFYYDVFDSVNDFFSDFKNNVLKIFYNCFFVLCLRPIY